MSGFESVFFDLKGTLWDNIACAEHVMGVTMPKLMSHLPEDEDEDEVRRRFNAALLQGVREDGLGANNRFSARDRFGRLLKSYGIDQPEIARQLSSHYNSARRFAMRGTVRKGARAVLKRLRADNVSVGVITNGGPAVQRHLLRALALDDLLDHVISGEIEGHNKPDPRLFERALEVVNLPPEQMLYVGDSLFTDILGAKRAGIPVAWLHSGEANIPEQLAEPDYIIEELEAVLQIVRERSE